MYEGSSSTPERPRSISIWLLVAAAFAFTVALVSWQRTLSDGNRVTGARRVTWIDPGGNPISEREPSGRSGWSGCGVLNIGFNTLLHDGGVWTSCTSHEAFPGGALGRIDPERGIGRISWPFPKELAHSSTLGLVPGPDGQLGVIYWVETVNGKLAVGIAGREGWVRAPELLPGDKMSEFLAGAWVKGALEVVVKPAPNAKDMATFAAPVVVRLAASERTERQPYSRREDMCPPADYCGPVSMAIRRSDTWLFLLQVLPRQKEKRTLWEVPEQGPGRFSDWPVDGFVASSLVDSAVMGRLAHPFASLGDDTSYVMDSEGRLGRPKAAPGDGWEISHAWNHFTSGSTLGLGRIELWTKSSPAFMIARRVHDRVLVTQSTESNPDNFLVLGDMTEPGNVRESVVAKAPSFSCGNLVVGTFLDRPQGGSWLVEPSGCYLQLDSSYRRTDPLPLLEHLKRRGSVFIDWNEPWHAWILGWALFGLPASVGVGVLLGLRKKKRGRELLSSLAIPLGFYIVTGGYALYRVLPLLL